MKCLSGVNLCVLIEWLKIIKNLVSLPFVLLYLYFDICFAVVVFLTREQMVLEMDLWMITWDE